MNTFLAGCLAGLALAVPVGAVGALLIVTSATRGWRIGAAAGLGAATIDGVYAATAAFVGAAVATVIAPVAEPLHWVSAVALAVLGLLMIRASTRPNDGPAGGALFGSPGRAYVSLLGLTAVNPATVLYFTALVLGAQLDLDGATGAALFVLGVFLASASWQLVVVTCGAMLARVSSGPTTRRWTGLLGGGLMLVLAVHAALG